MTTQSKLDMMDGIYNHRASISASYNRTSDEVEVQIKDTMRDNHHTQIFKIAELQDRAILEALPDDVLQKLYQLIKTQITHRGLPL